MNSKMWLGSIFLFLVVFVGCQSPSNTTNEPEVKQMTMAAPSVVDNGPFANTSTGLDRYWYQGKGELNVYELQQNRYRGVHPGQVLLVFVSEPFLPEKQVKNDGRPDASATNVLKLNAITRFTTGIYDYSIMSSVFTPAETNTYPRSLKVTQSVQDWCGQVFSQLNYREEAYQQQLFSYFESEADQKTNAVADFLEDEIPNRIRIAPDALPVGKAQVIPSLASLRLLHKPYQAYEANLSLEPYEGTHFSGDNLSAYSIEYPSLNREITYVFKNESPYLIEGWIDESNSVMDQQKRQTIAQRKMTKLEAYWGMNSSNDMNAKARRDLGWTGF